VESVQCFALDQVLGDTKVDLIKVDCDGHDPFAIRGSENLIRTYHPVIITEIAKEHYVVSGCSIEDFYNDLRDLGYDIYSERDLSKTVSIEDVLDLSNTPKASSFNVICLPQQSEFKV